MRWTCLFDPPRHGSGGEPSGQSPARFRLIPLIKTTSPIEIALCEEKEDDLEALGSSNYHYSCEQVPQEEQAGCPGSPPPATGFFYLKFSVLFQFGRYQVEGLSAAGGAKARFGLPLQSRSFVGSPSLPSPLGTTLCRRLGTPFNKNCSNSLWGCKTAARAGAGFMSMAENKDMGI